MMASNLHVVGKVVHGCRQRLGTAGLRELSVSDSRVTSVREPKMINTLLLAHVVLLISGGLTMAWPPRLNFVRAPSSPPPLLPNYTVHLLIQNSYNNNLYFL